MPDNPLENPPVPMNTQELDLNLLLAHLINESAVIGEQPTMDEGTRELYREMAKGHCASCGNDLGPHAHIVLNGVGLITEAFCSPQCHQDLHIMGYLADQFEQRKQALDFRRQS